MIELLVSLTLVFIAIAMLKALYLILDEYVSMNRRFKEQHARLKSELKDFYGVNVITGVPKGDLSFADKNYSLNWYVNPCDCVRVDLALLKALSKYSDIALSKTPKEFFIVRDIHDNKTDMTTCGEYVIDEDCIVINATAGDDDEMLDTIHHELAHALTRDGNKEILSYQELGTSPDINIREEIADNWAYGFNNNDNDKANYLHTKYKHWLK